MKNKFHYADKKILALISLLPIFFYGYNLFFYTLNIPFGDDFPAVLGYLNLTYESVTLEHKIQLLFSRHAEHQIIICKLFALAYYLIFKKINFIYLAYIGNLAIIFLAIIFYKSVKPIRDKLILFLPVTFILLNFSYGESSTWAMAALSNFYMIFFAFAAIYFINLESKKYLLISIIFALFASFSFGGGLLVFAPLILICLYQGRHKDGLLLVFIFLAVLYVYFLCDPLGGLSRPAISLDIKNLADMLLFFIVFLGSPLKNIYLSFALGLLLLLIFFYLTIKKYLRHNIVIYSGMIFILILAAGASYSRFSFGIGYALVSRYAFYSSVYICLCYLAFVEIRLPSKKIHTEIAARALVLSLAPISLISYGLFPIQAGLKNMLNIPYVYFVQKAAGSTYFPIDAPEVFYEEQANKITSNLFVSNIEPLNAGIHAALETQKKLLNQGEVAFGEPRADSEILARAIKNRIYY